MVNIETRYMTQNPCYNTKRTIQVKGLVLHSVGCPQPNKEVFYKNWNKASYNRASIHGFIDNSGVIITLPCMETTATSKSGVAHRGWHVGSGTKGSYNNSHLGFEMTEPSCIKYTSGANFTCSDVAAASAFVRKNLDNAVELFAQLCIYHNLDPLGKNVIVSHREAHDLGYASGHADPTHLFTQLKMNYTMDDFRNEVNNRVQELKNPPKIETPKIDLPEMEDEDMTDERFSELMTNYLKTLWNNDAADWSKDARGWAINNGLVNGNGTTTDSGDPNYMWPSNMTREQFITVLYRFAKMYGLA